MATNNSLNINSTTPMALAIGGTNASLTASNGGIVFSDATKFDILAGTATENQVLLSGASSAPSCSVATYLPTLRINEIVYASAANTMAQITTANNAQLYTDASGVPVFTASMTDGQVLIGSSAGVPVLGTISAGAGISVTNGNNSITIAATASVAWIDALSTPVAVVAESGYLADTGAVKTVFNLPIAPAFGSVVRVSGFSAGGWIINAGAGDTIQIGSVNAPNSVSSANQFDAIELLYAGAANAMWIYQDGVSNGYILA